MPRFSIVIPCFNTEAYVGDAVRSCLAQTARDLEVIVVDDGSTDESSDVACRAAAGDPRMRIVQQHNQGVGAARNTGLMQARGEFVGFLDADDLLEPEKLAVQGRALAEQPDLGLALCDGSIIDASGAVLWDRLVDHQRFAGHPPLFDMFFESGPFPPVVPLVRREAALAVGGFDQDPAVQGWADVGFWLHLAAAGYDYCFLPQRLARYRHTTTSMTGNREAMERSRQIIFAKILSEYPVESARALIAAQHRLSDLQQAAEVCGQTHRELAAERDRLERDLHAERAVSLALRRSREAAWKTLFCRWARLDSDASRRLFIWGAGAGGRRVLERLRAEGGSPEAFVDSDPERSGTRVDGIRVVAPTALSASGDVRPFVLVASVGAADITSWLEVHGWRAGADYHVADFDLLAS